MCSAILKSTIGERSEVKVFKNNYISFKNTRSNYLNTGFALVKKELISKIDKNHFNFEKIF